MCIKKITLEIFILPTHPHPPNILLLKVWTRNGSCCSYCIEFYALKVFVTFFWFEQWGTVSSESATEQITISEIDPRCQAQSKVFPYVAKKPTNMRRKN